MKCQHNNWKDWTMIRRCQAYKVKVIAAGLLFVIFMTSLYSIKQGYAFSSFWIGGTSVVANSRKQGASEHTNILSHLSGENYSIPEKFNDQIETAIKNVQVKKEMVLPPKGNEFTRYIIYDCSKVRPGLCGGWSDRLSGILDTFVISIITGRHFKIYHDSPCSLEEYFKPNKLDWKYTNDILTSRTQNYMDLIDSNSKVLWKAVYETDHLETIYMADVTFMRINWDLTEKFRNRKHIKEQMPWISKLPYADIYFQVFHYLFSPGHKILAAYAEIRTRRKRESIACVHARNGDNSYNPKAFSSIWNFFSTLNSSKYDIFIASDSNSTITEAYESLHGFNVLATKGKTGNIDKAGSDCEVFRTTMLDFCTLTQCDVLVLTNSGFGMVAAYVRHTSDGLYCFRGANRIIPCSRYTLENFYPGNILAPDSTCQVTSNYLILSMCCLPWLVYFIFWWTKKK